MANKNYLNKNSQYVQSLVDFVLDTKPYHSKLTETVEEYQFGDNLNVKFSERLLIKTKISAAWTYNYFSSANPLLRTMPLKRLVSPTFVPGIFTVGFDENTDLANVPFVYSKKCFDAESVNAVFVKRADHSEPMLEGHDYFQSHGSFQFRVEAPSGWTAGSPNSTPLWAATNDDSVIALATLATQEEALDTSNPASAVNQIRAIIDQLNASAPVQSPELAAAFAAIYAILDTPNLPQSYEETFAYLEAEGVPVGNSQEVLKRLSPPLFFNLYTDLRLRQNGSLAYDDITSGDVKITNIVGNTSSADYEEWTIIADAGLLKAVGSVSGYAGSISPGDSFTTTRISFDTELVSTPATGWFVKLTPRNVLTIHEDAPLETWNIIKVNPLAYTRPRFASTRYGRIANAVGELDKVTLLDPSLPSGTLILTARADGVTFDLTSTAEPSFVDVAIVNQEYPGARLKFTILSGSAQPFVLGDRFFIEVVNEPARADEFDLGYGYDLDSYDNPDLLYDNPAFGKLNFAYDGRFPGYDLSSMNLQVQEYAVSGRRWRIVAVPNLGLSIETIKRDGSGPDLRIDLADAASGETPDPALNGPPIFNMPGDASLTADLRLYYASIFNVEYSDDNFQTAGVSVGSVAVGATYTDLMQGISFTLAPAATPFIAVRADSGGTNVNGGDVFSFVVRNDGPTTVEFPILPVSTHIPRLLMRGDGFYDTEAADWTVQFSSPTEFTVQGGSFGPVAATLTAGGVIATEGASFKQGNVHFTITSGGAGFGAGDSFTFSTFTKKPSYLVHGSVTGWAGEATIGDYFWNGKIGFTIEKPNATVFVANATLDLATSVGNVWTVGAGTVEVVHLREDTPSLTYIFTQGTSGYMVSRSDIGVVGFIGQTGTFTDSYVNLAFTNVSGLDLKVDIRGQELPLWNGGDLVILRPIAQAKLPENGEHLVVEKTENGSVSISLTQGTVSLANLHTQAIDQRFIDVNTGLGGVPLVNTSPDTAIVQGWVPLFTEKMDSITSMAEFSDPTIRHVVKSASTGLNIGIIRQDTADLNTPIVFEWDSAFFSQYLPLNAEANIVVRGNGWDDKARVHISESIKFLIDGGALIEDFLFNDILNVNIVETPVFNIHMAEGDSFTALIQDGPFAGFLPGYANVRYDWEDQPINLDPQESDNFGGSYDYESEVFGADDFELGIPSLGLGMDIVQQEPGEGASASIKESMVLLAVDRANRHDTFRYGFGGLNAMDERTAIFPGIDVLGTGVEITLEMDGSARAFEIHFTSQPVATPTFKINGLQAIAEFVQSRVYRISQARPSAAIVDVKFN